MGLILVAFMIFAFLMFLWAFSLLLSGTQTETKRVSFYLEGDPQTLEAVKTKSASPSFLLTVLKSNNQRLKALLKSKNSNVKVEHDLLGAGVAWSPSEYLVFRILLAIILSGLLELLTHRLFLVVVGLVVGTLYPKLWVKRKRVQRIKKFNDGLADTITSIVSSLRAGFSFLQALKAVEEESDSPIKEEFALVLKEMQYGTSLEEALKHLNDRMPSQDLEILIQAVLIQRQVGGNLATVLSSIVNTIRERNKIQRQVRTLTAQGKMSGVVIGTLPFALGGIIYVISPDYMGTLIHNPIGLVLLGVACVSGIIGFLLIQKLTTIEV